MYLAPVFRIAKVDLIKNAARMMIEKRVRTSSLISPIDINIIQGVLLIVPILKP